MSYQKKYLKYKNKYLDLKKQIGGSNFNTAPGGGLDSNTAPGGGPDSNNSNTISFTCQEEIKPEEMVSLECGCRLHIECLNGYLNNALGNTFGLVHIKCPSNPPYTTHKDISFIYLKKLKSLPTINKEVIDILIGRLKENIKELLRRQYFNKKSSGSSGSSEALISASSRECPNCKTKINHSHGHACHHIMGCPVCKVHFCFVCGSKENKHNCIYKGNRLGSTWTTYCEKRITENNIDYSSGIPRDNRCGCTFCPDCRFGKPCVNCKLGDCLVCLGHVKPGPNEILPESERYGWCLESSSNTGSQNNNILQNLPRNRRYRGVNTPGSNCWCCRGYPCDCVYFLNYDACIYCEDGFGHDVSDDDY